MNAESRLGRLGSHLTVRNILRAALVGATIAIPVSAIMDSQEGHSKPKTEQISGSTKTSIAGERYTITRYTNRIYEIAASESWPGSESLGAGARFLEIEKSCQTTSYQVEEGGRRAYLTASNGLTCTDLPSIESPLTR